MELRFGLLKFAQPKQSVDYKENKINLNDELTAKTASRLKRSHKIKLKLHKKLYKIQRFKTKIIFIMPL